MGSLYLSWLICCVCCFPCLCLLGLWRCLKRCSSRRLRRVTTEQYDIEIATKRSTAIPESYNDIDVRPDTVQVGLSIASGSVKSVEDLEYPTQNNSPPSKSDFIDNAKKVCPLVSKPSNEVVCEATGAPNDMVAGVEPSEAPLVPCEHDYDTESFHTPVGDNVSNSDTTGMLNDNHNDASSIFGQSPNMSNSPIDANVTPTPNADTKMPISQAAIVNDTSVDDAIQTPIVNIEGPSTHIPDVNEPDAAQFPSVTSSSKSPNVMGNSDISHVPNAYSVDESISTTEASYLEHTTNDIGSHSNNNTIPINNTDPTEPHINTSTNTNVDIGQVSSVNSENNANNFLQTSNVNFTTYNVSAARGIENLGNTCFMNSAIQCLSHTKLLSDYFHELSSNSNSEVNNKELSMEFLELQKKLQMEGEPINPKKLKSIIGRSQPRFAGRSQEDAQEFLTFLLDGLHEELNKIQKKEYVSMTIAGEEKMSDEEMAKELWLRHKLRDDSKIVDLFHGQIKSTEKCNKCNQEVRMFEKFTQLHLPIPLSKPNGVVSLCDCLNLYTDEKEMELFCDECESMVDGVQKYSIWRVPPVLIIHLKRFSVNNAKHSKLQTEVTFPLNLDLSQYTDQDGLRYELYGVIRHDGTLYSGHYRAYVYIRLQWYLFDDCYFQPVQPNDVEAQSKGAYVLFYQKSDE